MSSCKIFRILICIVACGWLLTSCKDDKLEIPKQLAGTTWRGWMIEGPTLELSFTESDCTLTTITTTEEGVDNISVKSYRYTYDLPKLHFVSKDHAEDILYGEFITDNESYLLLAIHNEDNSLVADLNKTK